MTQANRGLEGAVASLVDTIYMQRDEIRALAASQRESVDRLIAESQAQRVEWASAGSSIRELKGLARQTLAAIQETTVAVNGHLEVAQTQAQTVADLIAENRAQRIAHDERMAAIATVMERQQAAIDKLLDKVG